MGYFNKVQQLINKTSRHALVLVCMLACGMPCDAAAKKASKEEASKDAAREGLMIVFFQQGLNDNFETVKSGGSTNNISSDDLSAYEKFCISNNYRGRSAQENVLIYEKTATDFSSYFKSNRPRIKACTLSGFGAVESMENDLPIIKQHIYSGRYKDASDIARSRMKQISSIANLNFKEDGYAGFRDNMIDSQRKLQNIISEIEKLESDNNNQGRTQEANRKACKSEDNCFKVIGSDEFFTGGKYTKIVCLMGDLKNVEKLVSYDDKGYFSGGVITTRYDNLQAAALDTCGLR